jgi:hypothetical protein
MNNKEPLAIDLINALNGLENALAVLSGSNTATYYRLADKAYLAVGLTGKVYSADEYGQLTNTVYDLHKSNIDQTEGIISLGKLAWACSQQLTRPVADTCYIQDSVTGNYLASYTVPKPTRYTPKYVLHWTLDINQAKLIDLATALDIIRSEHNGSNLTLRI